MNFLYNRSFLLIAFLFSFTISNAAPYFWVGDGGNWNDLTHWASSTGGAGSAYGVAPGIGDVVVFDANSFTVAGQIVDVNVDANAASINFTGVTNAPTFSGLVARNINIGGDFIAVAGVTITYAGTFTFTGVTGAGPHSITSGGNTIANDILVNALGIEYDITDPLVITGQLGLDAGTLDIDAAVSCDRLDADISGDALRVLDFSSSTVTITGSGVTEVVDFQSVGTMLTVNNVGGSMVFSNAGQVVLELGDKALTIPDLDFQNSIDVDINTVGANTPGVTMIFNAITLGGGAGTFDLDAATLGLRKVYGGLVDLGDDRTYNIFNADGAIFGGANASTFAAFTVGNNGNGDITGDFTQFTGAVTFGTSNECEFSDETQFGSTFTVGSTAGNGIVMLDDSDWQGALAINGNSTITLAGTTTLTNNNDVTIADGVAAVFANSGSSVLVTSDGNWLIGDGSSLDIGNGVDGPWIFTSGSSEMDFAAGAGSSVNVKTGSSATSLDQLDINGDATVTLNLTGATTITGAVDVAATSTNVNFTNVGGSAVGADGVWTFNGGSTTNLGNGGAGAWTFSGTGDVILTGTSTLVTNANTSTVSLNDITLGDGTAWNIGTAAGTDAAVTGAITAGGDCSVGANLNSITGGATATLDLTGAQALSGLVVEDITTTTSVLVVTDGLDVNNNGGTISFVRSTGPLSELHWVGGMVANTNAGTYAAGGDDDWDNPDNWSTASGVYSMTNKCIPTITTPVTFDAGSFDVGGRLDVNLAGDANAESITFTGVDEAATFSGAIVRTVNIAGDLTLNNMMTYPFAGTYNMIGASGAGPFAITSAGASLVTGDVLIDALGIEYDIADALIVNQLGLDAGTLDIDAAVSCDRLDADISGDALRVLDFSSSTVTITGNGLTEVVDFRSTLANLTVNNVAGAMVFSNAGQVVLELGDKTLTIPNLTFTNSTDVDINTAGVATSGTTMTFNAITLGGAAGTFDLDNAGVGLRKLYNGIVSLGDDRTYNMLHPGVGAAFDGTGSQFNAAFTVGNDGNGDITGDYIEFVGAVTFGTVTECEFSDQTQFESTFTVGSTAGNHIVMLDDSDWEGDVTISGNSTVTLASTTTIDNNVTIADGAAAVFANSGSSVLVTADGNWSIGDGSSLDIGNGVNGDWDFVTSQMIFVGGAGSSVNINTGTEPTVLDQLDINGDATVTLTLSGATTIGGDVDVATASTVNFTNVGGSAVGADGEWTLNGTSATNLGNGGAGAWTFSGTGDMILNNTSTLTTNANTSTVSLNDITLGDETTWNIGTAAATDATITGTLTAGGNCSAGANLNSITGGVTGTLDLTGVQAVSGLVVEDITTTTSAMVVTDGLDVNNNGGTISFARSTGVAATLFWVGGDSGNPKTGTYAIGGADDWDNPENWSATTNVYTGTNKCIPTITTPVVFDAGSFDGGNLDVNIAGDVFAESIDFTGVDEAATFSGVSARTANIAGALTLNNTMTYPFAGTYNMTGASGAGPFVITSSSASLVTGDLLIDALGKQYELFDALIVDQLGLQAGTLDLNGVAVACTNIDADIAGDAVRVLDFNESNPILASIVTVNGSGGEVIDFQSVGGNLTLNFSAGGSTAFLDFTSVGQVILELGANTLNIPSMNFVSTNVDIKTSTVADPTNTIFFEFVTNAAASGNFSIDNGGNLGLRKVYRNPVNLGGNVIYDLNHANGTTFGTLSSEFSSTFTIGASASTIIRGDFIEFKDAVDFGSDAQCQFNDEVQFESTVDITSTSGLNIRTLDDSEWEGTINVNGNSFIFLSGNTSISGVCNVAAGVTAAFSNLGTPTVGASSNWNVGAGATLNIGNSNDGDWDFTTSTIGLAANANLQIRNGVIATTLNNLSMNGGNTVEFPFTAATSISGNLITVGASCNNTNFFISRATGSQADISLAGPESEEYLRLQDINVTTANLTVDRGADISNNTGATFTNLVSANLFWVGDLLAGNPKTGTFSTGVNNNWSNPDNWSSTDNVYPGTNGCIPTIVDVVEFTANSFSNGGEVVTVDQDAFAGTLTFAGVTNTPTFTGANAIDFQIAGFLTMDAAMNCTYNGDIEFLGSFGGAAYNVTAATQTIADTVTFNSTISDYTLVGPLSITGALQLEDGKLDLAGVAVTAEGLNCNLSTGLTKEFDFNSSTVSLTGGGTATAGNQQTVVDLRHDDNGNLTLSNPTTSLIDFTGNVEDVTVHLGRRAKTVPALTFTGNTDDARIITREDGGDGSLITIGDITVIKDGADLHIDDEAENGNEKTIGTITLPNDCDFFMDCPNGTGIAAGNYSRINAFVVGDNVEGDLEGDYIDIMNNSTFGDRTSFYFQDQIRFLGTVTVGGTENQDFRLRRESVLSSTLISNGTNVVVVMDEANTFTDLSIPAGNSLDLRPDGNVTHTVTGDVGIGDGSSILFGIGSAQFDIGGDIDVGIGALLSVDNGNERFNVTGDVTLRASSTWLLCAGNRGAFISGNLTAVGGSCTDYITMASTSAGDNAEIDLTNPANLTGVAATSVENDGANLIITGGQNGGDNAAGVNPVMFVGDSVGREFYWVGGVTVDPGGGLVKGGLDNLWSTVENWSTTSSGYDGQVCIPGTVDTVIFDAGSFDGTAGFLDVEVDVNNVSFDVMDWSANDDNVTFDPTSTNELRSITAFGSVTLDAQITNQYEGEFVFSNTEADGPLNINVITSAGVPFFGPVSFDKQHNTLWQLGDDLDIDGGERGDLTLLEGRLDPVGNDIYLEDDFIIESGAGRINYNDLTETNVSYTITFDGGNDNQTAQRFDMHRDANDRTQFYNLVIDRETNSIGDSSTVLFIRQDGQNGTFDVLGDIRVDTGNLYIEEDFVLNGTATTDFDMAAGTFLSLERENNVNAFPTGFINPNIDFDESSTVRYFAADDQIISGEPTYGNLSVLNGDVKTVDAALRMKGDLFIDELTTLDDDGNQIAADSDGTNNDTLIMSNDAVFIIGDNGNNTDFPDDFEHYDIDFTLGGEALIQYDGNGAQNVGSLTKVGQNTNAYAKVQFSNGGTKTLLGSLDVNTSLTIDGGVTLANAGNDTITFDEGNGNSDWIATGSGDYTNSASYVIFNGTAHDVATGSSALAFNNMTVQNGAAVTLSDDLEVEDVLTLTDGVVTTGTNMLNCTSNDAADIVGGSNMSFVNGNFRKAINDGGANTDTYRLHVGNGIATTDYFLAEFVNNNITNVGAIDVSVAPINVIAPNNDPNLSAITQDGTPINHIVPDAQWSIDRTGAGAIGGSYGVRLYLENFTTVSAAQDDYMCPVKRDDGATYADWATFDATTTIPAPGAPGRIYAAGAGYVEKLGYQSFSFHAVALGINPLPIELVYFDAKLNDMGEVDLDWETVTEINNDYFTLEKSMDGINFVSFSEVKGAGNSNSVINYTDIDVAPYSGVSYYRLKQTDFDGKYAYSDIVAVTNLSSAVSFLVYPNPSLQNQGLNIVMKGLLYSDKVSVKIYDLLGKQIYSRDIGVNNNSNEKMSIKVKEKLAKGNYILRIKSSSQLFTQKLIVQ